MNFVEEFEEVVGYDLLQHSACNMHPQSSKITLQPAPDPRFKSVLDELTRSCLALFIGLKCVKLF